MKHITLFAFLLCSLHVFSQSFGPDRIVYPDTTYDISEPQMDVAFNGWIYHAFNYYQDPSTGYAVVVSKDSGLTWQTLIDWSTPGASGSYLHIRDMVVGGSDSSQLHVTLAFYINGAAGPESRGSFATFNGITGAPIGNAVDIGDAFTFGVSDLALSSDSRHPLPGSSPYSVFACYSQRNNTGVPDSLLFYYSNDGGLNFNGPFLVATNTQNQLRSVEIGFGSLTTSAAGRCCVVWEQGGNLYSALSDTGSLTSFSTIVSLDSLSPFTNGVSYNPSIAMQSSAYSNGSGDYTTAILAERYDSSASAYDIVQFHLTATQAGGTWNMSIIDSGSANTIAPAIAFDEANRHFVSTWYNSTLLSLPCVYQEMDLTAAWTVLSTNYADTSSFYMPAPVIAVNPLLDEIIVSWIQETDTSNISNSFGVLKYDHTTAPANCFTLNLSIASLSSYACGFGVSCAGASDGSIDLEVVGGNPPYAYEWNGGIDTTQDLAGIPGGLYQVITTDQLGCKDSLTVTLTEPAPVISVLTSPVNAQGYNISCFGMATGSIAASSSGGCAPYLYSWSPTGDSVIFNLPAGVYPVTITDANGCQYSANIQLTEPPQLVNSLSAMPASCQFCCDGSATALPSGGTPPYSYQWSNGGTTQTIDSLCSGTYTVAISDSAGCILSDVIFVDFDTRVENNDLTDWISVFPNPSTGFFKVVISQSTLSGKVRLTDVTGMVVSEQNLGRDLNHREINFRQEPGVYFLQLLSEDGQIMGRQRVIISAR